MSPLGVRPGPHRERLLCVEANLEAMLGWHGVADTPTVLGALSAPRLTVSGEIRIRSSSLDDWLHSHTGLTVVRDSAGDAVHLIDRAVATVLAGSPVLVSADVYGVPWSPYRGHEHHEHGFVVDGVDGGEVHVVDAYTNATRYGKAEPVARWCSAAELGAALAAGRGWLGLLHLSGEPGPRRDPLDTATRAAGLNGRGHAEAIADGTDVGVLDRTDWTTASLADLAWLSLATWSVARGREMHACWWAGLAAAGVPGADRVAELGAGSVEPAWQRARSAAYLAWRRVEAGRVCPPALRETVALAAVADASWTASIDSWLIDSGEMM